MKGLKNLVFGVPFDPLDNLEKVKLKQAYLMALETQRLIEPNYQSPYDFFRVHLGWQNLTFVGELDIPQWLRPKPTLDVKDYVTQSNFTRFLEEGGCEREAKRVYRFVKECGHQCRPVMLGVDHSSTFGSVKALAEKYNGELALVIFDAHCDIINDELFLFNVFSERSEKRKQFMHCGNFVRILVNTGVVKSSDIAILGVTDILNNTCLPQHGQIFEKNSLGELTLVPQSRLNNPDVLINALKKLAPQHVYISLDIDVGANAASKSPRFPWVIGLNQARLLNLFEEVRAYLHSAGKRVVGLDVMEIDIHLLEVETLGYGEVGTRVVVESFLGSFL